jgi:hypothetical protein
MRRVLRVPRIVGYVLIGMLLGASGLRLLDEKLLNEAWIFVDIALGLVLYELGLRLDFSWLKRDRLLLATGVAESALSFGFIYYALRYFDVGALHAAVAAAIGVATSPAVVMLVAQELKAEGQVTERALRADRHQQRRGVRARHVLRVLIHPRNPRRLDARDAPSRISLRRAASPGVRRSWRRWVAMARQTGPSASSCWCSPASSRPSGCAHAGPVGADCAPAFGVFAAPTWTSHDLAAWICRRSGSCSSSFVRVTGAQLQLHELVAGGTLAVAYILARFAGKLHLSLAPSRASRPGTAGMLCLALTPMSGMAMAMVQGHGRPCPSS